MQLQRWISMGLRGKVAHRVGFPLNMKLQSKRSCNCARGLNEESGSEGWILDTFTGGCRLSAVWPLLVSLYSTVTDRNWRRKKTKTKKQKVDFIFFPFMNKCNCTSSSKHVCVDSWWKTRALSLCVQRFLTSSCCSSCQQSQLTSSAQQATKRCHRYVTFPTLFCFTFHS